MAREKFGNRTFGTFWNFWNFCKKKENKKKLINEIITNKQKKVFF